MDNILYVYWVSLQQPHASAFASRHFLVDKLMPLFISSIVNLMCAPKCHLTSVKNCEYQAKSLNRKISSRSLAVQRR